MNLRIAFPILLFPLLLGSCLAAQLHIMDFKVTKGPHFGMVCHDGAELFLTMAVPIDASWSLKHHTIQIQNGRKIQRLTGKQNEHQRKHNALGYIFQAEPNSKPLTPNAAHHVFFTVIDATGKEHPCEATFNYRPYP